MYKRQGPKRINTPQKPQKIPKTVVVVIFSLATKRYESGSTNRATDAIEIPAKAEVTYCCPQLSAIKGAAVANTPENTRFGQSLDCV